MPDIVGKLNTKPSFAIWGDSHANHLLAGLSDISYNFGKSGYNLSYGYGVMPLIGIGWKRQRYKPYEINPVEYNQSVLNFIIQHKEIKVVILAGFWSNDLENLYDTNCLDRGKNKDSETLKIGLIRTVNAIQKTGRKVVIVCDVPTLRTEIDHIFYARNIFYYLDRKYFSTTLNDIIPSFAEYNERNKDFINIVDELKRKDNITILHPEIAIYNNLYNNSIIMLNNSLLYRDYHHLTIRGSKYISYIFNDIFKY